MEQQMQNTTAKITVPDKGRVITDEDQYEDSMTELDEFDLAKMFKPNIDMDLSPVAAPDMVKQIDDLLAKGNTFRSLNDKYVEKFVTKGNEELYELLGSIYGFMLKVNESPYRDHTMKKMRDWLNEERSINLGESTPIESVVVRYIIPSDRQTAFNYARVLKVAFIENIAAKDLAGYIKGRGGITKIQDTLVNVAASEEKKKTAKKKLSLFKKIVLAQAKNITKTIEIPSSRKLDLAKGAKKSSFFEFAILDHANGDHYRVHQVVTLPEAIGEQWLNYISQTVIRDDVDEVQSQLDKLRAKLGITSGYGMTPGDEGYVDDRFSTPPAEETEMAVNAETEAD
jgi:hypothetical protein